MFHGPLSLAQPFEAVNLGNWVVTEGWMKPSLYGNNGLQYLNLCFTLFLVMKPSLYDGYENNDLLDGTQVQFLSEFTEFPRTLNRHLLPPKTSLIFSAKNPKSSPLTPKIFSAQNPPNRQVSFRPISSSGPQLFFSSFSSVFPKSPLPSSPLKLRGADLGLFDYVDCC
uniref:Uncharacterized protein n=1 Tax=Salix viminalis TaxID=40686 RepID=A0A6N2LKX9_SALVM